MKTITFDIETIALPEDQIDIPVFDPAEVKLGNVKDPIKIAEKLAEAERKHRSDILDNAALDATTGTVALIAYQIDSDGVITAGVLDDSNGEAEMLRSFWALFEPFMTVSGFNIKAFDLPFLVRRSWKHRVVVPARLRRGRYWSEDVVDLREVWLLGDTKGRGSLDSVARFLGIGAKTGDGSKFGELYRTDRAAAVAYALNDLAITVALHQRIATQ